MKVTNPNEDRAILAEIDGAWYEIPAGESYDTDDYVVASTLVEYGATAVPAELAAARELWADRNRDANSRTASASASEGKILVRRQRTVDVSTGAVDGGGPLKGAALDAAVAEANAAGAGISATRADEKRQALALWQASRGASTPVADEFQRDDAGELVLDGEGQPIPLVSADEVARPGTTATSDDPTGTGYDDEGFPLGIDKPKPDGWADLSDEEKRAYVYDTGAEIPGGDPSS